MDKPLSRPLTRDLDNEKKEVGSPTVTEVEIKYFIYRKSNERSCTILKSKVAEFICETLWSGFFQ